MNHVFNSQGYTQAALWNRIPSSTWGLMAVIAICGNLLIGYGAWKAKGKFFLIKDIKSPRGGCIRIQPQKK
jgi:hypothetical protein